MSCLKTRFLWICVFYEFPVYGKNILKMLCNYIKFKYVKWKEVMCCKGGRPSLRRVYYKRVVFGMGEIKMWCGVGGDVIFFICKINWFKKASEIKWI